MLGTEVLVFEVLGSESVKRCQFLSPEQVRGAELYTVLLLF